MAYSRSTRISFIYHNQTAYLGQHRTADITGCPPALRLIDYFSVIYLNGISVGFRTCRNLDHIFLVL